jgi:2-polyprenyl-3-methyl-5-hydroxy-6-metoxy-1,4-benzoquinol methylase
MRLNLRDAGLDKLAERFGDRKRRFLDIGCATGRLLSHMKSAGWDSTGVEICADSCRFGRKRYGVRIRNSTLEAARFRSGSFEVVHMSHVIEHVPDPSATLTEIRRVLVPGGLFLCVTPNVDGFQARWFKGRWRSAHKDHLTLFSTATLRRMLVRSGFRVLKQFSYGGLAKGAGPDWVKRPLDAAAKAFNFGDVTAFVCEKPE